MLQNIRDKSQGWFAWLIVGALITTFALWGIHSYFTEQSKDNGVAAYVNKQVITTNEVNTVYERLRQQKQYQLGADFSMSQAAELRLKKQALNQLMISTLLSQSAYKAGYRVTTSQVNEGLLQIPAFQVNGQFSIDRFHDILNGILYSQAQFLSDMRESMLINQVEGGYVNSAFALPKEIDNAIRLINQKRDIHYVIISASRFNKKVNVSSDEIKQYYQQHQTEFQSPEQVRVQYLALSLPAIKSSLAFDKIKLQQYYENNLQNYTQPASWHVAYLLVRVPQDASPKEMEAAQKKLALIEQKIKKGADFSQLVKQYSDDAASAAKQGILPWFSAGTLEPAFEKAVATLQTVGEVSPPVKTTYGFSFVKLLGTKKARVMPFDEVKAQVKNTLAATQAQQTFTEESDKLSNLSYANPDTLTIAAKALGLPIQTTPFFDKKGTKEGLTSNPRVVSAAFSPDVLVQGNNSDILQLDPNTAIVLRVVQHSAATVLPLAEVENTIQLLLMRQKAQAKAQEFGADLIAQLKSKKITSTAVANQYHLSWQIEKNAGRYELKVDSAILNKAFHMPRPTNEADAIEGIELPSGDYGIIIVNAVHDGQLGADSEHNQQRIFAEQLENNIGRIDYMLYVHHLISQAKIRYHQTDSALNDDLNDNVGQALQ